MALRVTAKVSAASAAGIATVVFTPPTGYQWQVNAIAISNNGVLQPICLVSNTSNFICGSNAGKRDSADGSPIPIKTGGNLTATFIGCTIGSRCTVVLTIQETPIQ